LTIDKNSKVGLFLSHVIPGVTRPLRILWHEVTGFVFICMFVWWAPSTFRNLRAFINGEGDVGHLLLTGPFELLVAYFGVTSFLRARKITRS